MDSEDIVRKFHQKRGRTRDPRSGKNPSRIRIQGVKKHRIPDLDPQHWSQHHIFTLNKKTSWGIVLYTSFSISAGSLTPLQPTLTTFEAIISACTKPYAKRVSPVNQGPKWGRLMRGKNSRKSRDTVSLTRGVVPGLWKYRIIVNSGLGLPNK
jgi:hypothetical protein